MAMEESRGAAEAGGHWIGLCQGCTQTGVLQA